MPDCYNCKYKRDVPNNAHIACGKFDNEQQWGFDSIAELLRSGNSSFLQEFGLTAVARGVENGWCYWPLLYDPIWIVGDCRYFASNEEQPNAQVL